MVENAADRQSTADNLRRELILRVVAAVVAEHGVAGTSISLVTERAQISRRAFYQSFTGISDCLVAVIDQTLDDVISLAEQAFEEADGWAQGTRHALAAVLTYFDRKLDVAHLCLVETAAADRSVREHRDRALGEFLTMVVAHLQGEVWHASPLAPQGMFASVIEIVRTRLLAPSPEPLIELLGPLMGIVVSPFMDAEQVNAEIERAEELVREIQSGGHVLARRLTSKPEIEVPAMLSNPKALRARQCISFLVDHPGSSNGQIAAGAGIAHESQASKLLADLFAEGLLSKSSEGVGRRNAWCLTRRGEIVAQLISA
jgi:AcrR family transcriptional regulator